MSRFEFKEWTEDLSYVTGAYIGKGYIQDNRICLKSIDKDFVESFRDSLVNILKEGIPPVCPYSNLNKSGKSKMWFISIQITEMCEWLNKECGDKRDKIPESLKTSNRNIKRRFLEGYIDGKGYINISKVHKDFRFMCGMSSYNTVICDIAKMAEEFKIITGRSHTRFHSKNGELVYDYRFDLSSMVYANINFSVRRKVERFERVKKAVILRDFSLGSHNEWLMIKSDLNSDIKRCEGKDTSVKR